MGHCIHCYDLRYYGTQFFTTMDYISFNTICVLPPSLFSLCVITLWLLVLTQNCIILYENGFSGKLKVCYVNTEIIDCNGGHQSRRITHFFPHPSWTSVVRLRIMYDSPKNLGKIIQIFSSTVKLSYESYVKLVYYTDLSITLKFLHFLKSGC